MLRNIYIYPERRSFHALPGLRPSRRLTSKTIYNALRAFVVQVIANNYLLVCLRALWDAQENDETLVEQIIPVKRKQLEMLLGRNSDIMIIWSCITGIEEGKAKEKSKKSSRTKRKRDDEEETEEETSEEEQGNLEESRYVIYFLNHLTI